MSTDPVGLSLAAGHDKSSGQQDNSELAKSETGIAVFPIYLSLL